ncbi:MAG TPA: M20/M25/M40 family metallo-hydrolase, partial [Burkholderiales bacterium]|nr:M20/M25/M40 family metallo-hydrolase [Burkholderiales bacterium]
MTRESAISRATRHFDDGEFIADLARRVAYRTESQVPESRPHLGAYLAQELGPAFERIGFKVQVFENPVAGGGPLLLAERLEDPGLPTVLSYGHGDVIRGLADQWRTGLSPWELKQEGGRYYGRGSADNKAQHSINMAALATVIAERGKLGFNAKFLIETGEEVGSPGLQQFCERESCRLKADVLIASDGPRLSEHRPTIYLGSRGALNMDFTVDLREGAHHSGNWGGLLANPGVILAHALASIVTREGKVLVPALLPERIPDSV